MTNRFREIFAECNLQKLVLALLVCTLACSRVVFAAPEEIQVYLDDTSNVGQFGLDVHNNYVVSGSSAAPYPGGTPPAHEYRLTPEFYYGLTQNIELGLYLLTQHDPVGSTQFDGEKIRIKYVAPHESGDGMFWGLNLEYGRLSPRTSPTPSTAELKGIYGYREGAWLFAVNPNLDWSPSPRGGPMTLDMDGKVAYEFAEKNSIGIELYSEFGPVRQFSPLNQNSKTLYLAFDRECQSFDLNAGLGRGLTSSADKWVVKFIVGTHF